MKAIVYVGTVVAIMVIASAAATWNAYALSMLWSWFVVPLGNIPALSIAHAYGITLVAGALSMRHARLRSAKDDPDYKDTRKAVELLVRLAVRPAVLLGVGWVVKGWM